MKKKLKITLLKGRIIEEISADLKKAIYRSIYRDKDKIFSMSVASYDKSKFPEKRVLLIEEVIGK